MDTPFFVTLPLLRKVGACYVGYNKVVRALQGKEFTDKDAERESYIRFAHKEPIEIVSIIESNGFDDALWALRCVKNANRDIRLYAVWCARQVEHLMEDPRSKNALDVSERYANGLATDDELYAARSAARSAACSAARSAACSAASNAAWSAAWSVASNAAWSVAWSAARSAAWSVASNAAWSAARSAQEQMLVKMCNKSAPWQ